MKKNVFSLIVAFALGMTFLNAQEYAYQNGFVDDADGDGWLFSGTTPSTSYNNGLYTGDNGLKMKSGYIQTPVATDAITLYFWYLTRDKSPDPSQGTLTIEKSIDDGGSWTTIDTLIITSSNNTFVQDSCPINEEGPVIIRLSYDYVAGFFYMDDVALTKVASVISPDNVEMSSITSTCKTVSSEDIDFQETNSGVFLAHDSIAFDAVCDLSCEAFSGNATVAILKSADPLPGKRDTAIFQITSEDQTTTAIYKAIVSRSLFQAKMGFPTTINQNTSSYDGWSFAGKRYPSSSKGGGGTYPGENAMRIYEAGGSITTPQFSSVKTVSFVAKFSKSDGESLVVQKSNDGLTFTDIKTYTPGEEIPAYTEELASDTLSVTQTLTIEEEDVFIRFLYVNGNSTASRTMVDDIAVTADYEYNGTHDIFFNVYDFNQQAIEGVTVTLGTTSATTDANGEVSFTDLPSAGMTTYTFDKADYISKVDSMSIVKSQMISIVLLKEELEIFLALGQSNMAGRAPIDSYTDSIEGAYLLDDNSAWVAASNPMNLYSNIRKDVSIQDLGPSYSFAQTMSKYLDKRVCMIVNARGGTTIQKFAEGGIYNSALMSRVDEANDYGDVKAAIWHQGEGNSKAYSSYLSILDGLVTDMRETTNDDFFFVAGQLGPWYDKYKGFNDNLSTISTEISNASYVVNDSLWHRGDSTHFNTISQIVLGQRYAQSVLQNVYAIDVAVFNLVLDSNVTVSCGDDIMDASGSFTPLWNDDSVLLIETKEDDLMASLTINGIEIVEAVGQSSYAYTPSTADQKIRIEATIENTSALENVTSSDLIFFPNPASDIITFQGGDELYKVKVFDMTGREVLSTSCHTSLGVSMLTRGAYILHVQSGECSLVKQVILY